tara:strand:+ start:1288 stop:1557 length:270 start_codon:yes stop_codon:yes gene_type:complete
MNKFKYIYLTLALLFGLLIGAGTTGLLVDQHYKERVTVCKDLLKDAQEKTDAICGGLPLGHFRMTEITCPGTVKEICLCAPPENLQMLQ